jgi:hypothetical protein
LGTLEHIITDLLTITEENAENEQELNLSWEEREAAGIAELLRIHQDALHRPLTASELASANQIVASLDAARPQ